MNRKNLSLFIVAGATLTMIAYKQIKNVKEKKDMNTADTDASNIEINKKTKVRYYTQKGKRA